METSSNYRGGGLWSATVDSGNMCGGAPSASTGATTEIWKDPASCWRKGVHMDVRILTGIKTDQDGLSDVSRSNGEPERPSSQIRGSRNDESGGCELEQMTTKTDNELSLGGVGG